MQVYCRNECGKMVRADTLLDHEENCWMPMEIKPMERLESDTSLWKCWKCGIINNMADNCRECNVGIGEYDGDLEELMTTKSVIKKDTLMFTPMRPQTAGGRKQ